MKHVAIMILGSFCTAAYWWTVFTIVYADVLFAGDRNPALPPPSDHDVLTRNIVTIVVGILIYAFLSALWQRLVARLRSAAR